MHLSTVNRILTIMRSLLGAIISRTRAFWRVFRGLKRRYQVASVVALILLIGGISLLAHGGPSAAEGNQLRTVTLRTVSELTQGNTSVNAVGSVRSIAEASILAEAGGTVRAVHGSIGSVVPAGFVLAELENSTEAATLLQAQGAYDAALASQSAVSPADAATTARNAYESAFSTIDTAVTSEADAFFGEETPVGPRVLLDYTTIDRDTLSRARERIRNEMNAWRDSLANAAGTDPQVLLTNGQTVARDVQTLVENLARSASESSAHATSAQLTAIAGARTAVNSAVSSLAAAQTSYRSGSVSSSVSVAASVKSALGTLRLAQANFEKTLIRAPIGGTVNFLPIRVGDYVTNLEHVATVAQNGALEIVLYVSEEARAGLSVGAHVTVENTYDGIITQIAPALDPVTKQIEVHVGLKTDTNGTLLNGQSVSIALPGVQTVVEAASSSPALLPLTSVKLTSQNRVLFTVGPDNRLMSVPVTIGEVLGDRIQITSPVASDLRIVTDARGLSEGQEVHIATSTP